MIRHGKAAALLLVVALTGACGGSSGNGIEKLSADKALAKVTAATKTVKSVHVKGEVDQNGQTLGLDVHAGKGTGQGTLSIGGGTVELRLVSGTAYLRGDDAALTAFGASSQEVTATANKWIKSSATTGPFQSFTTFLELDSLFGSLLQPNGTIKVGKTSTIDGQKALSLLDTSSTGGTLYVAETGKPLPLRVLKAGSAGGHIDFLDYDEDINVQAPPGAIDISQLGG